MSGQIVKKTDYSEDLKGQVMLKITNYFRTADAVAVCKARAPGQNTELE